MNYDEFVAEHSAKGLIRKQKTVLRDVANILKRARIDLKTAKVNLKIDKGTAYSVAYLAMLRAGRALMLFKGFRPDDGSHHKTVVEFAEYYLGDKFSLKVAGLDIRHIVRPITFALMTVRLFESAAVLNDLS